jgi:hypothetical protein
MKNIGIFHGHLEQIYNDHLVYVHILRKLGNFVAIWHIFAHFGILYLEKSGNPASQVKSIAAVQRTKNTKAFFPKYLIAKKRTSLENQVLLHLAAFSINFDSFH